MAARVTPSGLATWEIVFAALSDPQGASFSVIDITTTKGEMPKLTDVS